MLETWFETPFPHFIIPDFFPKDDLDELLPMFQSRRGWVDHAYQKQSKRLHSPAINDILTSQDWLDDLTNMFDIPDLISDPNQEGSGLHRSSRGGRLGMHVDFNSQPAKDWRRRINLIAFVNPHWDPNWLGATSLKLRNHPEVKQVYPVYNTALIFESTDDSLHGFPSPILCPEGAYRQTITAYYYTKGTEGIKHHQTLYEPDDYA